MSKKSNQFSPEIRERAVRMVREYRSEYRSEYPSLWAAIESIAPRSAANLAGMRGLGVLQGRLIANSELSHLAL